MIKIKITNSFKTNYKAFLIILKIVNMIYLILLIFMAENFV